MLDALIGNFDRHAGNWGYILDKTENQIIGLAPVYDCGSSFYPQLNENAMSALLKDPDSFVKRTLTFPTAALRINNKKVRYHEFLLSPYGKAARSALYELYPKLHFQDIENFIADIPDISQVRCLFYQNMISLRHDLILRPALDLARNEHEQEIDVCHHDKGVSLNGETKSMRAASAELSTNLSPSYIREKEK